MFSVFTINFSPVISDLRHPLEQRRFYYLVKKPSILIFSICSNLRYNQVVLIQLDGFIASNIKVNARSMRLEWTIILANHTMGAAGLLTEIVDITRAVHKSRATLLTTVSASITTDFKSSAEVGMPIITWAAGSFTQLVANTIQLERSQYQTKQRSCIFS